MKFDGNMIIENYNTGKCIKTSGLIFIDLFGFFCDERKHFLIQY